MAALARPSTAVLAIVLAIAEPVRVHHFPPVNFNPPSHGNAAGNPAKLRFSLVRSSPRSACILGWLRDLLENVGSFEADSLKRENVAWGLHAAAEA